MDRTKAEVLKDMGGHAGGEKMAQAFAVPLKQAGTGPVVSSFPNLVDDDQEPLTEIPQSFAEIYAISNRNRFRNKDKKRKGDGEESLPVSVKSSLEVGGAEVSAWKGSAELQECGYFKETGAAVDTSAEATVK